MADKFLFLQKIYGDRGPHIVNREKINSDEEFDKILNDLFIRLGETEGFLYYDTSKFLLEDDPRAEISKYLKENSDEIAKHLLAVSLRFLRHPNSSSQYNQFSKYYHVLTEDADWAAFELDLLGHRLENEEDCQSFATKLQSAFDSMSGDKIDAVLAVRFGKDIADKNDSNVLALYNAAIEDLKAAVK